MWIPWELEKMWNKLDNNKFESNKHCKIRSTIFYQIETLFFKKHKENIRSVPRHSSFIILPSFIIF